jgi:glycosyltransferase involved in cell wall biosynthesis
MPAVSVIMPAYNVAPYVGAAIESVLAQTVTDLEILVVDDGSTDETAQVVGQYMARDARVRLLQQRNGGISSARNHALREIRGGIVALLDGDDMWAPRFLEEQTAILDGRPDVDIVTGNAWNLGGGRDGSPARPWPDGRPAPDVAQILADEESVFIMSVFRRRVCDRIGGFDEALPTNEDYDYWLRASLAGFTFARNDRPLGYYRRRSGSLSSSELRMLRGILCVYEKARPMLTGREVEILARQVERFETERLAAEVRSAISSRDMRAAARHLAELRRRRPGRSVEVAHFLARWTPGLLARAYHLRQVVRGTA